MKTKGMKVIDVFTYEGREFGLAWRGRDLCLLGHSSHAAEGFRIAKARIVQLLEERGALALQERLEQEDERLRLGLRACGEIIEWIERGGSWSDFAAEADNP